MCWRMALRYKDACRFDRAIDVEDLVMEAAMVLPEAAASFDPAKGKTRAGWARWYIQRAFERALGIREKRFTKAHTGALSMDAPMSEDWDDTMEDLLIDGTLPEADEDLLRAEAIKAVREAVAALPDARQRKVIQTLRLEGKTFNETAEALDLPLPTVKALDAAAKKNLCRKLYSLDDFTRFHAHKGVEAFNRDWTSTTEAAALWRIEQRERREL